MLAHTKTVQTMVKQLADMRGNVLYRRAWCDKAADATKRNLAFRFDTRWEADAVARRMVAELAAQGYTNKVKRTSVSGDWEAWQAGGEYVRVQALF